MEFELKKIKKHQNLIFKCRCKIEWEEDLTLVCSMNIDDNSVGRVEIFGLFQTFLLL